MANANLKPDSQSPAGQEVDVNVDRYAAEMNPEVSPTTKEVTRREGTWIKPLRTYKYDVAEALKKGGGSLTRIVLAQQKKKAREKQETSKQAADEKGETIAPEPEEAGRMLWQKNSVVIAASILVFLVGIGIIFGAIAILSREPSRLPLALSEEIIVTNTQKQVTLEELSENEIRSAVRSEMRVTQLDAGAIEGIYFVKPFFSEGEVIVSERPSFGLVGVRELFFIIQNRMPPELLRSFNDQEFLFGFHRFRENNPFLILKTGSFENTFSGMLKWERFMFADLEPLFALDQSIRGSLPPVFEDRVLKNRDVRILADAEGETKLIYAFIDRETLVITTSETTFNEVVARLKAPKKIIR